MKKILFCLVVAGIAISSRAAFAERVCVLNIYNNIPSTPLEIIYTVTAKDTSPQQGWESYQPDYYTPDQCDWGHDWQPAKNCIKGYKLMEGSYTGRIDNPDGKYTLRFKPGQRITVRIQHAWPYNRSEHGIGWRYYGVEIIAKCQQTFDMHFIDGTCTNGNTNSPTCINQYLTAYPLPFVSGDIHVTP